jgi:hypothetical protein
MTGRRKGPGSFRQLRTERHAAYNVPVSWVTWSEWQVPKETAFFNFAADASMLRVPRYRERGDDRRWLQERDCMA